MAWIGAAALLLGLGFFLKYAMDRGWIGPEVRVGMGLAFGAALYGLGVYLLRKDYRPVGQGVVGSSLGFWYLSLYAGHHWYSLISEEVMFGAMAVGAGAVLGLAIAFDAQVVAIIGVLGGFLAPLLMKTSTPSPWPLFRFLLLVDAAALAGASFRRWRIAELVALRRHRNDVVDLDRPRLHERRICPTSSGCCRSSSCCSSAWSFGISSLRRGR